MIASISLWLKSVITIVILGTFVELLLPEGALRKYIGFAVGLLVLVTVIQPVLSIEEPALLPPAEVEQGDYQVDTSQIAQAMAAQIQKALSIDGVQVMLSENREVEAVYVTDPAHVQLVADYLGLPASQIQLKEDANGTLNN